MKKNPCHIKVKVKKDANTNAVETAIAKALKTEFPDVKLPSCRKKGIVITVKFDNGDS